MVEKTSERVLKKRGRKKIEPEANKYYIKGKTYEIVKTILKSDDILTIKGFRDSISKQVIPQILSEIKEFVPDSKSNPFGSSNRTHLSFGCVAPTTGFHSLFFLP